MLQGVAVYWVCYFSLELGAGSYESLACGVVLKLLEVVDEHFSELGSFCCPFFGVGVCVAGIENVRVYTGQFGRNSEVEDGELLGGSAQNCAVKDCVDDAAGVLD